jgi:uncharacterized Zn finger protein (UPF0148 family)
MTKRICRRCGGDLTEGATVCAICGEVAIVARSVDLYTPETTPLIREETEQTVPPHAAPTEEMPVVQMSRKEFSD